MLTKNATVIYPKGSLGKTGYRNTEKRMIFIFAYDENSSTEKQLEIIWRYANRVDNSPIEEQLNNYQERSMMVGDYVILDGIIYRCAFCGFEKVDAGEEVVF